MHKKHTLAAAIAIALAVAGSAHAQDAKKDAKEAPKKAATKGGSKQPMTFFVTSVGSGKGGDLGGLKGADAHCQQLAKAAGAGNRTWRAYLSANEGGKPINARDRIGKGPWYNAKGDMIARNVDDLHDNSGINKDTGLTEKGDRVKVRPETPNMHDILTGSDTQGNAIAGNDDTTCRNWTSSDQGNAMVGHLDRAGLDEKAHSKSWNRAHMSAACSQPALVKTGGNGLFYCFAAK
jgi:hypothetical protein